MDDLTRVAIVDNEIAAELAVSRLRMEGIHAMWRKTDMASAVWGVGITEGVGGPVEILVLAQGCAALRRVRSPPTRGPGESKGLGGLDD